MKKLLALSLALFCSASLITAGCSVSGTDNDPDLGTGDPVWVALQVSGGQQCGPRIDFDPPVTEDLLADVGIEPLETKTETHGLCEACSCALYAATHMALIRSSNLQTAQDAGFEWIESPGP